ncbi:MAG: HD domain-containing protein [Candidatus Bathyarchaeia archaeon]
MRSGLNVSSISEPKIIRCPLYGFVDVNQTENAVLNTTAMQRLSRIKQLAHTYIVYPSAVHTRLEHSLGTLYLSDRICTQLRLPSKQKKGIRVAALLHDVGQGPFSHIWEEPMRWINGEDFSHENITKLIVEHDPQVKNAVKGLKNEVLDALNGESIGSDIISSSLDVDKLDYLRRDSYHTGVTYGIFDIERVIRMICKLSESGRDYLAIREKGKDALESYRLARYAMHIQVYEHHTRLIADDMFIKSINLALEEGVLTKEELDFKASPEDFIENYLKLDDFSIQHKILLNSNGLAKNLVNDIRNRNLLKRALVVPLTKDGVDNPIIRKKIGEMTRQQTYDAENKIADELGINSAYVTVHVQSIKIKLYERFEQTFGSKEKPIYVKRKNGSFFSFDEESPIFASLIPVRTLYVFCPEKYVSKARQASEGIFKVKSFV